jgi:hypothetical protein
VSHYFFMSGYPRARIEIYEDDDALLRVVKANKNRLFPDGKGGAA